MPAMRRLARQQVEQEMSQQPQHQRDLLEIPGRFAQAGDDPQDQVAQGKAEQQVDRLEAAGQGGPGEGEQQVEQQQAHGSPPSTAPM